SLDLGDGLFVAALVAVNSAGDVVDVDGSILAGVREAPDGKAFLGALNVFRQIRQARVRRASTSHTVVGVVATKAQLDKDSVNKVAQMAQDGLAQAIRPSHTLFDGDTVFALATGQVEGDLVMVNKVGAFAAEVVAQAIRNGVRVATSMG